jgi:Fur family transcriptional regulator, ferric uptake regulator
LTGAPDAPRLRFASLDEAIREMRRRGLRLSTSRRLILEALFSTEGPVSAEHVARARAIDVASVYRNLDTMERHGLVHHVHLGHGPGLYVLVGRGELEYLFCERCGAVRAASPGELDPVRAKIEELFGYGARFTHFPIVGVCAQCAGAPADGSDPPHIRGAGEPRREQHEHGEQGTRDTGKACPHSHGDYVLSHVRVQPPG